MIASLISIAYFVGSRSDPSLSRRLLTCVHGALIAFAYVGALLIADARRFNVAFGMPFLLLLVVPVVFAVISIWQYRGPKLMHLLQVPNVACLVWTAFVGTMAVTGEWL